MKTKVALTLFVAHFYVLLQGFGNWHETSPLAVGFPPIGLAYDVCNSQCAAGGMALLVIIVSLITRPLSGRAIARYVSAKQ